MASSPDLINCPRCGSSWCESDGFTLLCPSCLYIEEDSAQIWGRPSVSPSDVADPDSEDDELTETLGELIEQVPSDFENWELRFTEERFLKMNAVTKQEPAEKKPVTVYDILIAEEGKNGKTYWKNAGVAFPLTNGSNGFSIKIDLLSHLRLFMKESVRAVGAAKHNQEYSADEEAPF